MVRAVKIFYLDGNERYETRPHELSDAIDLKEWLRFLGCSDFRMVAISKTSEKLLDLMK